MLMEYCKYFTWCTQMSDWWAAWGPLVLAGVFIGIPVIVGFIALVGGVSLAVDPNDTDPQCTPSRKPITAGKTSKRVIRKPKRTIHTAGKPVRWKELERAQKREKVKR